MATIHPNTRRRISLGAATVLGATLVAGAAAGAAIAQSPAASSVGGSVYDTPLKGICPDTVVIQTNWYPEPEHGFTYQPIGANGVVDPQKLTYTGPLGNTGVQLEVRSGGPAIGYQQVTSILYQDDSILLGYIGTDEAIQNSRDQPTVAVFADLEQNPQAFLWGDPAWDFQSVADIGKSDATVLAFEGATYLDVFTGEGLLRPEQIDASYQGGTARFVAEGGHIVQQGFVTQEPYAYEHEVPEWGKPIKYLLVGKEYPVYQSALAIRADKLAANADCLKALVPIFQQAQVDYVTDPTVVNAVLVDYASKLDGAWNLSAGKAADAAAKLVSLGLVGNGPNDTLGDVDEARIQSFIDTLTPVFTAQGKELKAGLVPADVATNDFIDPSIGLR